MRTVIFLILFLTSCGEPVQEPAGPVESVQTRLNKGSAPLSVQYEIEGREGATKVKLKFQAKSRLNNITFQCDQELTKRVALREKRWFIEQINSGQVEPFEFEIEHPILDKRLLIRIAYEVRGQQLSLTIPITLLPTGIDEGSKGAVEDKDKMKKSSGLAPASKPRE